MSKILVTGGTGLIGQNLTALLQSVGHEVAYLSRNKEESRYKVKLFGWDIERKKIDPKAILWADQIVHLAGESVAGGRWTKSKKEAILASRINSTRLLVNALKEQRHHVNTVVSASAIGAYGSDLSQDWISEDAPYGTDFLAQVVHQWERETDAIGALGIRTVNIRVGIVLSSRGGALDKMTLPVKYGLGAAVGTGTQMMSWIHINDLAGMFAMALDNNKWQGVFNGVSPNVVSNKDFTKALAKSFKKPLFLPNVPGVVLKVLLGEMSELVLGGQRISSEKILAAGYRFSYPALDQALNNLLGSG